jgi:hypothetical protein
MIGTRNTCQSPELPPQQERTQQDRHPLVAVIQSRYNPGNDNYVRVKARDLFEAIGQTAQELDPIWDAVFAELEKFNLFIQPALPDVAPDEYVRVFRANGPLARVILEVLNPSPRGDQFLAEILAKIAKEPQQMQPPRSNHHRNGRNGQFRPPAPRNNQPEPPSWQEPCGPKHYTRPLE